MPKKVPVAQVSMPQEKELRAQARLLLPKLRQKAFDPHVNDPDALVTLMVVQAFVNGKLAYVHEEHK